MATASQKSISVTCPKCGHEQPEPKGAYSTICKKCRAHFRLDEKEKTAPKKEAKQTSIERKKVICFQCSTELEVPVAAESTMCKRCSSHVDLQDYQITATVSKNYRTHGRLVLEEKGYMMNTDSVVGDAILKGRVIGKITAKRSLEIFSTATIKGSFTAGRLIIPSGHHFRWSEPLRIDGAEISGELVANIQSTGTIVLKSTARLFGDVSARNLVIENGAIFVGQVNINGAAAPATKTEPAVKAVAEKPATAEKKVVRRKPAVT